MVVRPHVGSTRAEEKVEVIQPFLPPFLRDVDAGGPGAIPRSVDDTALLPPGLLERFKQHRLVTADVR